MGDRRHASLHGVVGGLLAATAIVLFFLVVDVVGGDALATPRFLSAVLLGRGAGDIGVGALALYTVLHYGVFAVIGAGTAWLLQALRVPATVLLGLVVGFLLFDLVFYASVALTGIDVVGAIGWPTFLAGNLVGGVVLMVYLSRTGVARGRSWGEAVSEHRVIREGVIAGVLGGVAVAAWFFALDLAMGRLLYTPGALGSALFRGVTSAAAVEITPLTILGYSAVHFVGFIVVGLVFAALVTRAEENPPLVMGLVLLFVTFQTLLLGLVAIVAAWLLEVVPWWAIALANVLAAVVMVVYLWRAHPRLRSELARADDESLEAGVGREAI